MRNRSSLLPILLLSGALLIPAAAAPAPALAKAGAQTGSVSPQESRLGRGIGRRPSVGLRPRTGLRPRARSRPLRSRGTARRFFRGVLQALGLAYLFHLLFGWGVGGSPLGLLLLATIVLFLVTRRRRRQPLYRVR